MRKGYRTSDPRASYIRKNKGQDSPGS